jgi:hypothetical protein
MSDVKVKTYKNAKEYEKDAPKMAKHGYEPQLENDQRGKVNLGRTLAKAVIFLPWAVMRPSRKDDKITITWVKH